MNKQRWDHFDPLTGKVNPRFRGGKTKADHRAGAVARAAARKLIPIRCTSNYTSTLDAQKGPEFWGG